MIGREAELGAIVDFLEGPSAGAGGLLIEGEPGIGKTTLWLEGRAQAVARGYRVLSCRTAETESKLALGSLTDLLAADLDEILPALPPPQRQALEIALLRTGPEERSTAQRVLAVAVLTAIRGLARMGPVLLAVDDTQWLDAPTSKLLSYAARRLDSCSVAFLLTGRPQVGSPPELVEAVPGCRRLAIGGLSLAALHRIIRDRLGVNLDRPLLTRITRTCGGNPFFGLEIVSTLQRQGLGLDAHAPLPVPGRLRQLVAERLGELPDEARQAVLAAFALFHPTPERIRQALSLAGLSQRGLDRAVALGVLDLRDGSVALVHPLLGSSLYAELAPLGRRALHRRLSRLEVDPEEAARHLALATVGTDRHVAAVLERQAGPACVRGAPEAAAELLELAISLTPAADEIDLLRRTDSLALAHFLVGDTAAAVTKWQHLAETAPPGPARARAKWRLAEFGSSSMPGGFEGVPELLRSAIEEAGMDLGLRADLEATFAESELWAGHPLLAERHALEASRLAERAVDRAAKTHALVTEGLTHLLLGHGLRSDIFSSAAALEAAGGLDVQTEILPSTVYACARAWTLDELAEAAVTLKHTLAEALERGDEASLAFLHFVLCETAVWRGEIATAEIHARACSEAVSASGRIGRWGLALYCRALVAAHTGASGQSRTVASRALALDEGRGVLVQTVRHRAVLGFVELTEGRFRQALAWLEPARVALIEGGYGEPSLFRFVPDEIEALVALGRLEEAEAMLGPFALAAERLGRRSALAVANRCRGLLQATRGRLEPALEELEAAIALERPLGRPLELARSLLCLGVVARRARHKAMAASALSEAGALFERLGAQCWIERCRSEQARVGLRPRAPEQLTATERKVAELLATGRTNREIAAVSFMSLKAVEATLTRIYRKLGVRSRSQLVGVMMAPTSPVPGRQGSAADAPAEMNQIEGFP